MSWRHKDDLGTTLVAKVHDQLKMTDDWIIDCGRGFTYWASDFAITVASDLPNFHNAYSIFRVHAEIDVACGHGKPVQIEEALARKMCRSALSALTYDPQKDMYKIQCSVYAHADNVEWLGKVLVAAVGLQIGRTPGFVRELEESLQLTPAMTGHPTHGFREKPDAMVNVIDQFIRPFGSQASKWDNSVEWGDAHQNIHRIAQSSSTDGKTVIDATYDWLRDRPIRMKVSSRVPHPDYGNGLQFSMYVPWSDDLQDVAHTAMELNEMERREWNWCHDLGSWCMECEELAFTCFLPNVAYAEGALIDLTHDMAIRAKWVNDQAGLAALGVE